MENKYKNRVIGILHGNRKINYFLFNLQCGKKFTDYFLEYKTVTEWALLMWTSFIVMTFSKKVTSV